MRPVIALCCAALLAACTAAAPPMAPPPEMSDRARVAVANFLDVVDRVEPVAETLCRTETPHLNCDFRIVVSNDTRTGINAFQTVTRGGQPLIVFTIALIAAADNTDELAFVMGHEAGHHIAEHIAENRVQAAAGARVLSDMARQSGANARVIAEAAELGSLVASRRFSQAAELEADVLGTAISLRAGFDPVRGAAFFERLPDLGGAFLSTHPSNAARMDIVRRTARQLREGNGTG